MGNSLAQMAGSGPGYLAIYINTDHIRKLFIQNPNNIKMLKTAQLTACEAGGILFSVEGPQIRRRR